MRTGLHGKAVSFYKFFLPVLPLPHPARAESMAALRTLPADHAHAALAKYGAIAAGHWALVGKEYAHLARAETAQMILEELPPEVAIHACGVSPVGTIRACSAWAFITCRPMLATRLV